MNGHVQERFRRGQHAARYQPSVTADVWILPQQLNNQIRLYYEGSSTPSGTLPWLAREETPSSAEVMDVDRLDPSSADLVELVPNKPEGAWDSKEAYLSAQYELAREEAVRPIREAVSRVRSLPNGDEDALHGAVGVYEKAHICAMTYSTRGIAIKITFSLARSKKKIIWEQSKRLISGSLVVLTPKDDMFKTTAIVATVASRSLAGVLKDPPEIDLFTARAEELEIDPAKEWVMIEDRSSYFEAGRHTLLALQKMMQESFPLQEHLVRAETHVPPPKYLQTQPILDLSAVLGDADRKAYNKINVLSEWPAQPNSDLDVSQLAALRRALTKQLAVIQGPPGTGKTFVSVQAILVLLTNWKDGDPPIIIACQTNHAIDQILRHIASFTSDFIRLGGRSKDRDIIMKRTLFNIRHQTSEPPPAGCLAPMARKKMKALEREMQADLSPLHPSTTAIDPAVLVRHHLLNEVQQRSLEAGASDWIQSKLSDPNEARNPFNLWLGDSLSPVPARQPPDHATSDFMYEAAELEIEQLREMETENVAKDDDEFDNLYGDTCLLVDNFTCRKLQGSSANKAKILEALHQDDMWKIPEALRGAVYRHLQSELKTRILEVVRPKAKAYNEQAKLRRIGGYERDEVLLKQQKIIGMTTTGLSKYRGLLAALSPKIVLIEEAAETLEAPVTVACLPSVQQLILVGDHKQLRPHCQVKSHERKPFFLDVSLFERLINNNVEYNTLVKQRRMIPEIRRLLYPIYKDLISDHASVLNKENRPDVPGMAGVNSLWFTHKYSETRDAQMSMANPEEAEMVVGMVGYLCYNGMDSNDITILTFYNGQRQELLRTLRKKQSLSGRRFNVCTVDSYQGEENRVVLLSLVRSNTQGSIGFLGIDNRICVALSRAQCGFYIFGNGELLHRTKTWKTVLQIMAGVGPARALPRLEAKRLSQSLEVTCTNHGNKVLIKEPDDWEKITGGCEKECGARLPCGHTCQVTCHPFSHDFITCEKSCIRTLSCGHVCGGTCGEPCFCRLCSGIVKNEPHHNIIEKEDDSSVETPAVSTPISWRSFASEESQRYALAASAPAPRTTSPEKMAGALDGITPPTSGSLQSAAPRDVQQNIRQMLMPELVTEGLHDAPSSTDEVKRLPFEDWSKADSLLD
nr:helicase required for rnai-mediated heterochromatin assembly 1 [Quercus suber]